MSRSGVIALATAAALSVALAAPKPAAADDAGRIIAGIAIGAVAAELLQQSYYRNPYGYAYGYPYGYAYAYPPAYAYGPAYGYYAYPAYRPWPYQRHYGPCYRRSADQYCR